MKGCSIMIEGQRCFIDGPDLVDQVIMVNGRAWMFDFDDRLGPLWLRKDGEPRECQNPNKAVWDAFNQWMKDKKEAQP